MSQINVNRIKDSNEGAPDFPSGVNVSGITSTVTLGVTNLNTTNVNVSGVVTATTLDGNLLATGTPTLGLGVTINTSGVNISGVATAGIVSATTLFGNGANITGIALTIAPLNYNPAVFSQASHLTKTSGIGLTFNQGVKAGSGNVTLSLANAGVAGTVVENFGVGNSVTYSNGDTITITPTADLSAGQNYHLSYPSGAFTNIGGDVSYVGTAYTFQARIIQNQLWAWGANEAGCLGLNDAVLRSSPTQIPGILWNNSISTGWESTLAIKTDGTLWIWGENSHGDLGQNNTTKYSSPVQVPGTTWSSVGTGYYFSIATKTDGTLWSWGYGSYGVLGVNSRTQYSSPVQVPGTTWAATQPYAGQYASCATKTDGTLWTWGTGGGGILGQNSNAQRSSPVQVPGTTWGTDLKNKVAGSGEHVAWIKTDGTLWTWGNNPTGELGHNNRTQYSSPKQIPGTTWKSTGGSRNTIAATKTDGTLWVWGFNEYGQVGDNSRTHRSSPVQIPGTDWDICGGTGVHSIAATKTNGTLWMWGNNDEGELGQNTKGNSTNTRSSPTQIPGTNWNLEGVSSASQNDGFMVVRQVI